MPEAKSFFNQRNSQTTGCSIMCNPAPVIPPPITKRSNCLLAIKFNSFRMKVILPKTINLTIPTHCGFIHNYGLWCKEMSLRKYHDFGKSQPLSTQNLGYLMQQYWLSEPGQQTKGPLSLSHLEELAKNDRVSPRAKVCLIGNTDWTDLKRSWAMPQRLV